jgi:hypothetical protein
MPDDSAQAMPDGAAVGIEAARHRVAARLERARHVTLGRVVVGTAPADVVAARRRALAAAEDAGRGALVRDGRAAAAAFVDRAFAGQGFSGTWAMTEMAVSVARPADRAAFAEALADAVTADAVDDLVDGDTIDVLRDTWAELDASSAIPDPGSISNFAASVTDRRRGTVPSLIAAAVLLVLGLFGIATGSVLAVALLALAAVAFGNALRR